MRCNAQLIRDKTIRSEFDEMRTGITIGYNNNNNCCTYSYSWIGSGREVDGSTALGNDENAKTYVQDDTTYQVRCNDII